MEREERLQMYREEKDPNVKYRLMMVWVLAFTRLFLSLRAAVRLSSPFLPHGTLR